MSTVECRLSIGDPIEIELKKTIVSKLGFTMAKHWNLKMEPCSVTNKRGSCE